MVLSINNSAEFQLELMQWILNGEYSCRPDYCFRNGVEVRVKGHDANWSNFIGDVEEKGINKFLSVTVGNYDNKYNDNMTVDEFSERYEVDACEITIEDGTNIEEAKRLIVAYCNQSNIELF